MTRTNVTRAAEGFDRRAFTVQEILRMQDAGIIADDENFELIEGDIVPMQAKTHVHEFIKSRSAWRSFALCRKSSGSGSKARCISPRIRSSKPDLVAYPRGIKLEEVKGTDIVLAIEVALTSLTYDRGLKAQLYARHGVQELWVIDASRRRTHVTPRQKRELGRKSSSSGRTIH